VLGGCGGGSSSSSSSTTTTTTTTTSSPTVATTAATSDQDSFSFSAQPLNPEGWDYDGQKVTLTIYASDHFNNPVPDGETVWFSAEGGQIDNSCLITAGSCTVTWTSTGRRPIDGRVTVTAWMTGVESWNDNVNANGMLDDSESYSDLAEVFFDYDEDGVFDAAPLTDLAGVTYREEFLDFDGNNAYSAADGSYNGSDCNPANTVNTCGSTTVDLRSSLVLIMSGSFASTVTYSANPLLTGGTAGTSIVTLADLNNQTLPSGTTVAVSVSTGLTLDTPSSYTINSTNTAGGASFSIGVTVGASYPGTGVVTIKVTTPRGNITTLSLPVV
jgi:hypothetical protein